MDWTECTVHTTYEAADVVSYLLTEWGSNGVVVQDARDSQADHRRYPDEIEETDKTDLPETGVVLKAYFPYNGGMTAKINGIQAALGELEERSGLNVGEKQISMQVVKEEDWESAWKDYYKPVKVSQQLSIVPTWEDYQPGEGEIVIELDPGMAFGTGTHPTTILCLQAIETIVQAGDRVMDVGTGSGILSIAAAKFGAASVHAYDFDEVALKVAKENIQLNGENGKIQVSPSDLFANIQGQANIIVGNLLADIIIRMAPEVKRHLKPNGYLVVSGIIDKQKESVKEALASQGFIVIESLEMEDWVALLLKR